MVLQTAGGCVYPVDGLVVMEGYKELLGIWIAEHEGASFRAQVLT